MMEASEGGHRADGLIEEATPEVFGIIGRSPRLMAAWRQLVCASRGSMSVHIQGETGTGKELFAAALHRLGKRRRMPYVIINCATLNNELATSELFGHKRGAFTGAVADRCGAFEDAHGGTLFLDEVGELRPETQAKLLRVLETKVVRRVGEGREIPVDVRVVSATNRPLRALISEGKFREDLFQRLCCMEIYVPPLRERRGDIVAIAEQFLRLALDGKAAAFSDAAKRKMIEMPWRGNIRELRNLVERSKIVCDGIVIGPELIEPISTGESQHVMRRFRDVEFECLKSALDKCDGNIRATAKLLDLSYSTVRSMVIRFGLDEHARERRDAAGDSGARRSEILGDSFQDDGGPSDDDN